MSFNWKSLIGDACPVAAHILEATGPVGALAGSVISGICSIFGLTPSQDNAQQAAQLISDGKATPEQIEALHKLDLDHIEKMAGIANQADQAKAQNQTAEDQISEQDLDSARKRQESEHDKTPQHLTYMALAACVALCVTLVVLSVKGIHPEASLSDLLKSAFELFSHLVTMAFAFFLAGGHNQPDMINKLFNSMPIVGKK